MVVGVGVTPGVVDAGVSIVGGASVVGSIAGSISVDVVDDDDDDDDAVDAVRSIPCWAPVFADDGDGGIVDSW